MTRVMAVLVVLSPLALAVPALIRMDDARSAPSRRWTDPEPDTAAVASTPRTPRISHQPLTIDQTRPITGFAINAHHIADVSLYLKSVDEVAKIGANALIVLTPMFQDKADSNEIRFVADKCATDEQLIAILSRAREKGLHTTLLPIVLIEHPGEKDWRGVIRPTDWDRWWETYDQYVDRFVGIANKAEVDLLAIGSELNSTEDQLDRWKRVAKNVRDQFKGQITYSANWDRYEKIPSKGIWNLVDVICVSSYFELERDDPDASEELLVRAWKSERDKLIDFAEEQGKPLLLSEVGYPSVPWASAHPWNYVIAAGSKADHQAQAKCWRAFFDAWGPTITDRKGSIAGFFCYHWNPYYHGDDWDTTYGVEGKPSYQIIKNGFARIQRDAAAAASSSD